MLWKVFWRSKIWSRWSREMSTEKPRRVFNKSSHAPNMKEHSICFISNALVHFNIILKERKACGVCEGWILKYPIFQAPCKNVSELILTYFHRAETGKSAKRFTYANSLKSSVGRLEWSPNRKSSVWVWTVFLLEFFAEKILRFINLSSALRRRGLPLPVCWKDIRILFLSTNQWLYTGSILF